MIEPSLTARACLRFLGVTSSTASNASETGAANVFFARYHFSGTANNGQVMSVVDDARQNGANIGYTYDALKRLTTATTTAWTQNVTYDGFGNITYRERAARVGGAGVSTELQLVYRV